MNFDTGISRCYMEKLIGQWQPRKKQQQQDVFSRILPMLATPFIFQTTLLPIVLISMKFMLLNSLFIGKLAILLWAVNLYRNRNDDSAALYSHNINVNHDFPAPGHFHEGGQHYVQRRQSGSERRKKRETS
ncbi:hypothetical protein NQ318_021358 [Aromia moschata]|uniref:Uncharacterized protein n=1 Tax=Aromia moschata TaxID=1265417 RepID=A0AAV8ZBL1_9CUCU|nr:hypothetical protein NQ318_021358 [Aromia moschata]